MKPAPTFTELKDIITIDRVLHYYQVPFKPSGQKLVSACPIHKGSNQRAFSVTADRKAWYCFGDCRRGGTVLDLIMALEQCSLLEAHAILCDRFLSD